MMRWRWSSVASVLILATVATRADTEYHAFSLNVARKHIQRAGDGWRNQLPSVVGLGGITAIEGLVVDMDTRDLILVGQKSPTQAAVSLDDLVVALRARLVLKEWPLVSIDPQPDEPGRSKKQLVRFEGGIRNTAFGFSLFDADYDLKTIGMGLKPLAIDGLLTYWDRGLTELAEMRGLEEKSVNSRFWFYPISPQVTVRDGVCVVRGLKIGVFTEVLGASINGVPVANISEFRDSRCDAFARDVTEAFERLCERHESFNRLRGLQQLVALSKALETVEPMPELGWWLHDYVVAECKTPVEIPLLERRATVGNGRWEVNGGVQLTALAMNLKAGKADALREAVLRTRPQPDALVWSFLVADKWLIPNAGTLQADAANAAAIFAHAEFLFRQKDYDRAIAYWLRVARTCPDEPETFLKIGLAFERKGMRSCAADYYTKALTARRSGSVRRETEGR